MASEHPISVLSEDESWRLLASVALGRLATTIGTRIEMFPVNFVVVRRTVLFRTAAGTKLISAVMADQVLFQDDDHNLMNGWSEIVRGSAELLETPEDIAAAERAQLLPWTSTVKRHYVRITPHEISARYFEFGTQ